jgi:hypothetical protein
LIRQQIESKGIRDGQGVFQRPAKAGEGWATGRRKDNPAMQLLYSLVFWAVVVVTLAISIANVMFGG